MTDEKDVLDLDELRKQFAGWEQVQQLIQEVEKLREETGMDSEIFYPAMSKKIDSLTRERGTLKTKLESETLFKNNNYELCKELEARNELSRIAYNQIEERVEKLKADNAELRHNFEQDRKVIANLKAQLSKSQERVDQLIEQNRQKIHIKGEK